MSESTKPEWSLPPLDGAPSTQLPTATEKSAAHLEADLQNEREARKEERFYWILSLVIVGSVPLFKAVEPSWALLPVFLLELILLIGVADWLGVDRVKILLERVFSRFSKNDN